MALLSTGIIAQIPREEKDFITTMMMTIVLRGQRDYTSLLDNTPYLNKLVQTGFVTSFSFFSSPLFLGEKEGRERGKKNQFVVISF